MIVGNQGRQIKALVSGVQSKRVPLYKFWFGLSKGKGKKRAIGDMAMYASFGYCPKIDRGVILCADSRALSGCYNLFKNNKTPVIYLAGSY